MPLAKLLPPPGVVKSTTDYGEGGRWIDGDKYRFVSGQPEKIGGFAAIAITNGVTVKGVPRGSLVWRDNSNHKLTAFGTNLKLYEFYAGTLTDITPLRKSLSGSLSNAITTTNASTTVTVTHAAHGLATGDWATLTQAVIFNAVKLAGNYQVTVTGVNTYTVVSSVAASATGTQADASATTYSYYRVTLANNPFTTVSGSATVTVTHTAHGAQNNDFVTFGGAATFNNVTISGNYQISGVTTNAYTITAGTNANASSAGGGATVTAQYEINTGGVDSIDLFGYGVGVYNTGTYGTPRASTAVTLPARIWTLQQYGQTLYAQPVGGTIYTWDPTTQGIGNRALPLYNAPATMLAMFITDERFVIALGISGNNLQEAWPDQNDSTAWTPTATNTANSGRNVIGGGSFVGGIKLKGGLSLLYTDTSVFTQQYTGDNFVFDTHIAGSGCGLVGPMAAVEFGGAGYWMSDSDFWIFDGYPRPLQTNDIRDFVFQNLSTTQRSKCVAGTNKGHREIWFFYPSLSSREIDSYVIYHVDQQCFSTGTMQRTSWVDKSLFPNPIAWDASGTFYNHESGVDANGSAMDSYIILAPTDFSNLLPQTASGVADDRAMDIFGLIPDVKSQTGILNYTILTRTYPQDANTSSQVYALAAGTQRQDTRESGKMIGLRIESNVVGGMWRYGALRVDVQPAGARR